jgi:hypothetical protein
VQREKISKADICLLAGIILVCGIVLISFYVFKKPGLNADIMISGETVKTVDLSETAAYIIYSSENVQEDITQENSNNVEFENSENYIVDGKSICIVKCSTEDAKKLLEAASYNVMIVEDNSVNIIDADCPDKVCVNHSSIESIGETIICLPHKLVVEIKIRKN